MLEKKTATTNIYLGSFFVDIKKVDQENEIDICEETDRHTNTHTRTQTRKKTKKLRANIL